MKDSLVTETLAAYIARKAEILKRAGIDQAKAEIELMLCHLLKVDRLHLYLEGQERLTDEVKDQLEALIGRRVTRYPLQYILGEAWFYGRAFLVTPDVMVPTPETELLCETAIGFVQEKKIASPRILDIGTGSGVIAITLAKELPGADILAVDISAQALNVAKKNAERLGAENRIRFRQSDFFSGVTPTERFDLIVSNPPYISESEYETLPPEVLADPPTALLAGEDGLDAIRHILSHAPDYLAPGGRLMFEIGYRQAEKAAEMTESDERYQSIVIMKDLNDIDRIVILGCEKKENHDKR